MAKSGKCLAYNNFERYSYQLLTMHPDYGIMIEIYCWHAPWKCIKKVISDISILTIKNKDEIMDTLDSKLYRWMNVGNVRLCSAFRGSIRAY